MQTLQENVILPALTAPDAPARRCKVEVEIHREHYLVAANCEPEYLGQLAAEVDLRMRTIALANPQLGPMRLAILTLLGLAADVKRLEHSFQQQEESLMMRCREIERDIERLLGVA
ncbi:MAG: cell division protein ZapA [Acidobacteriota bacterium]